MDFTKIQLKCSNCTGSDFYLQDGLYFCEECGVQYENLFEMETEWHGNDQTNYMTKIGKDKSKKNKVPRLTSFEEYNHILIGFVDEILNIEKIPNFKITCLQLWISFLRQSETAFFDKEQISAPKMFAVYRRADAEILYNKPVRKRKPQIRKPKAREYTGLETLKERRKKIRISEKIISSQLSESSRSESFNTSMLANLSIDTIMSDHENLEIDIEFSKAGKKVKRIRSDDDEGMSKYDKPCLFNKLSKHERSNILTGSTLLHIIYCALNICESKIQLIDLIRFIKEGHLSFFKCKQLLPEELTENDVEPSFTQHHKYFIVSNEYFRNQLAYFTKLIPDLPSSLKTPNLIELVSRYLTEMQLPEDMKDYTERLMIMFPIEMNFYKWSANWPNYEGRAMAVIVFLLKLLFGLDGYREEEISDAAKEINKTIEDENLGKKLFVYKNWRRYIEYRQMVLGKFCHLTLYHHTDLVEKPYVGFNSMLNSLHPKTRKKETQSGSSRYPKNISRLQSKSNAQEILHQLIQNHDEGNDTSLMNVYTFPCSFTPLTDNFQHILSHDENMEINRSIVMVDYTKDSCEAFLKPKTLVNTFEKAGIKLKTKKSTFPKSFVFIKPEIWHGAITSLGQRPVFKMTHNETSEQTWREKLRKHNESDKKKETQEVIDYHCKRMVKTLSQREYWKKQIRIKRYMRRKERNTTTPEDETDEPRKLTDPNIFSDSETDSDDANETADEIDNEKNPELIEDPELEELFKKANRRGNLTLVVPDYNFWQRNIRVREETPKSFESLMKELPENFIWLLKFASSVVHQHPMSLYLQLIKIEQQFVNVYQPAELFDNVVLKKPKAKYIPKSDNNSKATP